MLRWRSEGVLRSDDAGETLAVGQQAATGSRDLNGPLEPLVYPDVHSIVVHLLLIRLGAGTHGRGLLSLS